MLKQIIPALHLERTATPPGRPPPSAALGVHPKPCFEQALLRLPLPPRPREADDRPRQNLPI
ncbi:MAG: hypothetical protein IPN92_09300 [Chromatiaceae bacterium]|nr:hypothetical protein [Chromatiaceae bacterium]